MKNHGKTMKNKYVKRSKISEAKFRKIIMCFAMELDSQKIAALTSLNRNTVNRYLGRVRSRIVELCDQQALRMRDTGKHANHTVTPVAETDRILPVFGIQAQQRHIYTEILKKSVYRKLQQHFKKKSPSSSLSICAEWQRYDAIVDLNGRWHYQLSPAHDRRQAMGKRNGSIEDFLGFARKRLAAVQLNGTDHFNLYLKECEFRFNNRDADLYKLLLKDFRENPMS
jgi:transposase-like protein